MSLYYCPKRQAQDTPQKHDWCINTQSSLSKTLSQEVSDLRKGLSVAHMQ